MKKLITCLVLLLSTTIYAQKKEYRIEGIVFSEEDKSFLEAATIYLERVTDSSVVTYTISDPKGGFVLEGKTTDTKLNFFVSFTGFETYKKTIDIKEGDLELGTIVLKQSNLLDEIVIQSTAPITIKKDTLEFNVRSFKTKKGATVEDLLKVLPGVEVDADGAITVNGKPVDKVLVNGKPFFGNDPTITTRNLTKDIIEKVQIMDTKTKAEAFAGEEGRKEKKTINFTIKRENNKGVFGRVAAGLGTDKRNEYAGMYNYFNNETRLSLLAGGNNVNSPGFSFGEVREMFGRGNSISYNQFRGGEGITTSGNLGVNYVDKLGQKTDLSSSYFYSTSNSENESISEKENFLPDSKYFTNRNSNSLSESDSHRANIRLDIELVPSLLINTNTSFNFSNTQKEYEGATQSLDENKELTNQSESSSFVETESENFSNRIDITKRFGTNGSFLRAYLKNTINNSESNDYVSSETVVYDGETDDVIRNQWVEGDRVLKNMNTGITYRIPLISKVFFLDLKYDFVNSKRENTKSTYDFEEGSQDFTSFNSELSSDFNSTNRKSIPGIKLNYRQDKWSANIQSKYVFRVLENQDLLRPDLNLNRDFNAIELRSNFQYRFTAKASVHVSYNLQNNVPTLSQLQPFVNVSNPLNIIVGNPDLTPSNTHDIHFDFKNFDWQKRTGFSGNIDLSIEEDKVVSKVLIDDNYIRNTTYTNVNGNYNIRSRLNYSKTIIIDTIKSFRYNFRLTTQTTKRIGFSNDVTYVRNTNKFSPSLRLTYTWDDILEIRPRYSVSYTNSNYENIDYDDDSFLSHSFNLRLTSFVPKNFEWRNDIRYNYNPKIADGFDKDSWFWNSSIVYSFMDDNALLTLKVYDLLNQNTNVSRIATSNYIEDSQSTVLQQYFMLGFSWKFNSMGEKRTEKRGRGRRGSRRGRSSRRF